jgi:hypothetical protein
VRHPKDLYTHLTFFFFFATQFIVDFRKEQVNANLLNGKGEITDVSLNCAFLNQALAKVTPFIELESVHVSKLSFHVTAWSNLKKAPIVVVVEDVKATIVEPLACLHRSKRRTPRQISRQELSVLIEQGLHKLRGSYGLFDRIVDNSTVEIRTLQVTFQPRGKFKTKRVGPWTPPMIRINLKHVKYVTVDEFGQEGTPEQVWQHNSHAHKVPFEVRTYMIYKKLSAIASIGLDSDTLESPLVRDAQVEIHVAFRTRLRDTAKLAIQVDATLQKMEVQVNANAIPMLSHALAGLQYCFAKDRSFEDPLLVTEPSEEAQTVDTQEGPELEKQSRMQEVQLEDEEGVLMEGDDASESLSESDEPSSEGDDEKPEPPPVKQVSSMASLRDRPAYFRRPVILLPNGLVIHDRLSLSLSVHQCTIRGVYSKKDDGHVQLVVKGFVSEVMWPKVSGDKGGYVQASLSYISLQERFGQRVRSILLGGIQHDIYKLRIWLPGKPRPEKRADESFPLFEDRSIRPDPFGLRHTFPEQAFGLKTTVNYIEKVSNPDEEEIMVVHEIGIDQFDVLMDSDAWFRVFCFMMNEEGNGFDARWHSGDWSDELTTDMLVNPTQPLNLSDHLQQTKELFLDENAMVSSDLMNVTARIINMEVRVPAAIREDVRSCDIIVAVSEIMLVVSSALPRTFLTGKIGASIHCDGSIKQNVPIDFPNDPSDLCYSLEELEDPSIRQQGTMTVRAVSTTRLQLTARGFSVRIVPVIPFCNATPPQQLLEPLEMTMIVCFEGEPPESPESNLIKIVLFASMQIHRLIINCDLDIIAGATITLLRHANVIQETAEVVERLRTPLLPRSDSTCDSASLASEHGGTPRMSKNLKNRRVLVRRQFERSRETGGLSVSTCMQMAEFGFTFWRQNVPLTSRFRASLSRDEGVRVDDTSIALMKLLSLEMKRMEIGAEWSIQMSNRRVVLKGCLSALKMGVCDFEAERMKCLEKHRDEGHVAGDEATASKSPEEPGSVGHTLIELLTFGAHAHAHRSYAEVAGCHNDILIRAEERMNSTQSMSLACEVGPPGVIYLRVGEIETLCLLLIEALLMPTGIQASRLKTNGRRSRGIAFPDRSVGALFSWLARKSCQESAIDKEDISPLAPTESDKTDEVDNIVHSLLESYLPEKTHTVVARLMVIDVLVFVPEKLPDLETIDESRWLGLVVHQTALVAGFFSEKRTQGTDDRILAILASQGRTWSSFFDAQDNGIHVLVRAWPSLYAAKRKNSMCVTTDSLVSEFEISCSYRPSDVALSMGDTTLLVKNLDDLNHLYSSLLAVEDEGRLVMSTIHAVVSCLTYEPRPQRVEKTAVESDMSGESEPQRKEPNIVDEGRSSIASRVLESSSGAEGSFRLLKKSFGRLREVSEVHSVQLRDVLERQQRNIDTLRYEIFSKERDRVAALALVSSQATGWLRMGGTHTYGQRVPGVTTMWRYYAVLHNLLLILYSSPGQAKPIDIVVLDGARLFPLAGGHRKRDVQRGFSIIESGGVVRFFMAEGGPEYELWIREIYATINSGTGDGVSQVSGEEKSIDPSSGSLQDEQLMAAVGGNLPADIDGSFEIDEISFDGSNSTTPQRRAQLRARLSVVSSATKSKLGSATSSTKNILGSAVQAARQRNVSHVDDNRNVADSTSANSITPGDVAGSVSHTQTIGTSASSMDSVSYQHESVSFRGQDTDSARSSETNEPLPRGSRFASVRAGTKNRFGSAFQAAKDKGQAAAEQRRRRLQQQGAPIASPGRSPVVPVAADLVAAQTALESKHTELHPSVKQLFGAAVTPPVAATATELGASGDTIRLQPDTEPNAEMQTIAEHESLGNAKSSSVGSGDIQSEFLQSDASVVSGNEMAISGSSLRFQLKDKFGAAVKSVRRSTPQENSSAADDDNAGRFSLRRRSGSSVRTEADGGQMHDSSGAIKLRGVRVGSGNPADELHDLYAPDMDLQLRKIEGCWVTKVETCEVEAGVSPHLGTEDSVGESQALSFLEEGLQEDGKVSNTKENVGELQVASTFDEGFQEDVGASNENESMLLERDAVVGTNGAQSLPSLSEHEGLQQEGGDFTSVGESTHPNRENVVGTKDAQSLPPLSKRQVNLAREFRIHVFPNKGGAENAGEDCWHATEVVRSVSDVLALHATISACVSCLASMINAETPGSADHDSSKSRSSLIPQGNMTALDGVLLAGKLLVGLVESGSTEIEDTKSYIEYQCTLVLCDMPQWISSNDSPYSLFFLPVGELLKEFLNLTLDCPLPQNAIENVSRFLERSDIKGGSVAYEPSSFWGDYASPVMGIVGPVLEPSIASTQEILACTVSCENDLVRAETQGRYAQRLIESYQIEQGRSKAASVSSKQVAIPTPVLIRTTSQPFLEPLLPSEITENLHEAMHGALMNVMTERDESHAQLIAASVLHMHEMERERKKVNNLTEQLAATQRLVRAQQNAGGNAFFADKTPIVRENDDMKGKMSEIHQKMIQSSEEEMLALCQQLAGEISAKTSASLEIIRLKESRNIERENERAEKEALKNELKRYKELLAAEEQKANEARLEALAWKQSCEEATKTNGGDSPT